MTFAKAGSLQSALNGKSQEQQSVEWWLNGTKIKTSNEATLFWKIQPGAWQLIIKKANSTAPQDQVSFTVKVATPIKKRGFSLQRP
jgi:membrane carboxypeptidase/penicillin-binding protein PbpC